MNQETENSIEYIVCGQLVSENGFLHQKRCFDEHVLIMVNEGTLHINTGAKNYAVSKGQYIWLSANELHFGTKESQGHLSYFWIHMKCQRTLPVYGKFTVNGRISVLFHQLSDIAFEDDERAREMCNLSVKLILLQLERENDGSLKNETRELPNAVASAIEYVNRNYLFEISVAEIADKYGYTADYFSTLFKKNTGLSFTAFINRVRIRASKALLANYGVSIKEVAYSCGFQDEKYFMRVFKQLEGITPTEYRKNTGKSYINEK